MSHGPGHWIITGAFLAYVLWIVVGGTPNDRIAHGCQPILWGGNVVVTVTSFIEPKGEASVEHAFDRVDYVCRFSVWRLLYERDWQLANPGKPLPRPQPSPASSISAPAQGRS